MKDIPKDKEEMGRKAWDDARKFLVRFGWDIQQIDWLGEKDGKWVKFEVKCQEPYIPPPFKGHGLPPYQVAKSMKLYQQKGIPTYLIIRDMEDKKWIGQYIHELEQHEHFDTKGKSIRRIYPIEMFDMIGENL